MFERSFQWLPALLGQHALLGAPQVATMHCTLPSTCSNVEWTDAVPLHLVLHEVALESAPIRPHKLSMSMLLAMTVVTFKDCTVRPDFLAKAVVLVIDPIAIIVRTINVSVLALAI